MEPWGAWHPPTPPCRGADCPDHEASSGIPTIWALGRDWGGDRAGSGWWLPPAPTTDLPLPSFSVSPCSAGLHPPRSLTWSTSRSSSGPGSDLGLHGPGDPGMFPECPPLSFPAGRGQDSAACAPGLGCQHRDCGSAAHPAAPSPWPAPEHDRPWLDGNSPFLGPPLSRLISSPLSSLWSHRASLPCSWLPWGFSRDPPPRAPACSPRCWGSSARRVPALQPGPLPAAHMAPHLSWV